MKPTYEVNDKHHPLEVQSEGFPRIAYRLNEFCKSVGISRAHAYRQIRDGLLEVTKAGRSTLITPQQAQAWLENLPRTTKLDEPVGPAKQRQNSQA